MNNNHASTILEQIERIEKRMTSMQERGLDISALASQVIVAREMLKDGRYDDASIFCQELLDLADRIVSDKVDVSYEEAASTLSVDAVRQEDTKRFSKSSNSLNQQIKDVVDVGMLGRLRGQLSEKGLLDTTALYGMRDAITKRVAEEVCGGLQQQIPQADTSVIDQAFSYVIAGKQSELVDDPICFAVSELIAKTMDHSFKLYEQQLKMLLDQLSIEQKKNNIQEENDEEVMSVQVVRTDKETPRVAEPSMSDESEHQDDESFAGLPRIPRHGESLDDDSTFRAVTIDPTLSSSVFQSETQTASQLAAIAAEIHDKSDSDSYEPVTGSRLRPNTAVFTESNAMKSETASVVPVAKEIAEQSEPSRVDTMNKEEIKALLREMLPSLLEDEEIKQALFASLAIEMVTKPSVLGSLSGLRAFIQQELEAAQSGMVG